MGFRNFMGASVNGAGVMIATAKPFGTSVLDTTKEALDHTTTVKHGGREMTIKAAIAMGYLHRNAAGTLEELNQAQPYTRVG
jgi:hypothetical protein